MRKKKFIIGVIILILVFFAVSYFVQKNTGLLESYLKDDLSGKLIYICILIVSAVFAPVDVIFLMPVVSSSWGWLSAGLLSLIGWTIGSAVVFILSRKYGVRLIRNNSSLKKLMKYERLMPQTHVFVGIVFLRIAVPVDLVSYAIGIFTNIKFPVFLIATFIGFIPLAFFMAYLGTLPLVIQLAGFIFFLSILGIGYLRFKYKLTKLASE